MNKKIQKEIEALEFRKHSLVAPLSGEVQAARQRIDHAYHQIGYYVYQSRTSGANAENEISAHIDEIGRQNAFIVEREAKITEISARYDEEIGILRQNLMLSMPQAQPIPQAMHQNYAPQQATATNAFCTNCGTPYTEGIDAFCAGCGQKL